MDGPPDPAPRLRFGPDRRYTWAAAAGVVVGVLATVLTGDAQGRLLAGAATLVLVAYVITDLVFAPRLEVDARAVTVRSPLTRAVVPWEQVERVGADSRMRLGLRSTTLEVDAGPVLAVLSRRALGADPAEVADLVNAFRPR